MIITNSMRQLMRMKGRTVLFLFLMLFASGLLSLGRGFWIINREKTAAYEDSFMTIGTVEQKEDAVKEIKSWDAEKQEYVIHGKSVYHSLLPVSILDLEGVTYLSGPEKRICYGAYLPEYFMYGNGTAYDGLRLGFLVEASPVEDTVPDHPVKIRISKVWKGFGLRENDTVFLCDHYNPEPEMLHADKTYLMYLYDGISHGGGDIEFVPQELTSEQRSPDGEAIPCQVEENYWCEEVTEDFWESERSRWWRNLMEVWEYPNHVFPVTGTCNVELMMAFYNGEAYITSGRTFTEEEYEQGEKVCLIQEAFAGKYELKPGDQLRLPLLVADHAWSAGSVWTNGGGGGFNFLNAKGEPYEVFEDSMYTVVGVYGGEAGQYDDYGMGYNEVLIPSRSVRNSDADNIVRFGPMNGSTTSFQIENGTIDAYMEKWGPGDRQRGDHILRQGLYRAGGKSLQYGADRPDPAGGGHCHGADGAGLFFLDLYPASEGADGHRAVSGLPEEPELSVPVQRDLPDHPCGSGGRLYGRQPSVGKDRRRHRAEGIL